MAGTITARNEDGTIASTWAPEDEALLRAMFAEGAQDAEIGEALGRPMTSVRTKRRALGLNLARIAAPAPPPEWGHGRGVLDRALARAAACRNASEVIVALIPDNRDTAWWWDSVAPYAEVYPMRGRVQFVHPQMHCGSKVCERDHAFGEPTAGSPGASSVVVYLPDWMRGGAR